MLWLKLEKKKMVPFRFNVLGLTKRGVFKLFQGTLPEESKEFILFKGRVSHAESFK
jgi:hypothetical protein